MLPDPRVVIFTLLVLVSNAALAYRIIAPLPFSVINKNYIKLQVLAESTDHTADSAIFDVYYNGGKKMSIPLDRSFSYVLRLNEFNDGVFFIQARIYQQGAVLLLGSVFDQSGIPVVLDRHASYNDTQFNASYLSDRAALGSRRDIYHVEGNNNRVNFASFWDYDSLYFCIDVNDANLNYTEPTTWDLFQSKDYLQVLWNSDCIELGMDLHHDRYEWKQVDDVEFLVDVRGNTTGNLWSAADSVYKHWGTRTRTNVTYRGTINDNQDIDTDYAITIAIPWSEFAIEPAEDMRIGFDLQLYDKDADLDEAFRTSVSGTNPESNDNTSEWATLVLQDKPSHASSYIWWTGIAGVVSVSAGYFLLRRWRKVMSDNPGQVPGSTNPAAAPSYSTQTEAALEYIALRYREPNLSRQEIADHVAVTEKYLSTLFKKETGVNLVSYINKLRIEQSEQLLRASKLPVADIAFRVGYNSIQNFNKNFRFVTGKTPTDYRKS